MIIKQTIVLISVMMTVAAAGYVPDIIRLQYAGDIGMVSAGTSWLFPENKHELGLSVGFVPRTYAPNDFFIAAVKWTYTPNLAIAINEKLLCKPVSVGAVFSHSFGKNYTPFRDPAKFPHGYYWWNPADRLGLLHAMELRYSVSRKRLKGMGVYFETSLTDLFLVTLIAHKSYAYLNLWDILTFGVGMKFYM